MGWVSSQFLYDKTWSLATPSYDGDYMSMGGSPAGGFFIRADGLKLYVIGDNTDSISSSALQFTLSTAWEISTAVYDGVWFEITNTDASIPNDLWFSTDGLTMYTVGREYGGSSPPPSLRVYNLTVAWDLSSASYSGISQLLGAQSTAIHGCFMRTDVDKWYYTGTTDSPGPLPQWVEQTGIGGTTYPYTPSTKTQELSAPVGELLNQDLFFKPNGKRMFVVGWITGVGYLSAQYNLGTPWDFSTAVSSHWFMIDNVLPTPGYNGGTFMSPDGSKQYIMDITEGKIYQIRLV